MSVVLLKIGMATNIIYISCVKMGTSPKFSFLLCNNSVADILTFFINSTDVLS